NNNQIVAGRWYHLVVSQDATNFNFYINGKLRASRPAATTPFIPNGTGIRPENGVQGHGETMIGSLHDKSRTPFAGLIDDTAFYNYALSPKQVLIHYLNSTNVAPPEVTIQTARYNDKVVLTWSQGSLQSAPAVTGPYNDIPSATSPYTNTIGTSTFFRVKIQ
ncbi:MAG TPA: LamG domain-containing protein, partial [Candidatus Sulfotelmatobacter sp.]|nr:LamG domain-containing protein [Candidatus Sulfotelmatobacter sp.]